MTGEIKDDKAETQRVVEMMSHPWLDAEVNALANYFKERNVTPFEGTWIMAKMLHIATSSCIQEKKENKDES